jgi:hypothetical protein
MPKKRSLICKTTRIVSPAPYSHAPLAPITHFAYFYWPHNSPSIISPSFSMSHHHAPITHFANSHPRHKYIAPTRANRHGPPRSAPYSHLNARTAHTPIKTVHNNSPATFTGISQICTPSNAIRLNPSTNNVSGNTLQNPCNQCG